MGQLTMKSFHFGAPSVDAVDLICVYGYAVNADGTVPGRLEVRLRAAVELARRNPDAVVLLSGGAVHSRHIEAVVMRDWLRSAGVSGDRLAMLMTARDTVGNVREFVDHMERSEHRHATVAAVTSIEHLPRAGMSLAVALERRGHAARVVGFALDEPVDQAAQEWEDRHMAETIERAAALPAAA